MNGLERLAELLGDEFLLEGGLVTDRQGYYVADVDGLPVMRVNTAVNARLADESEEELGRAEDAMAGACDELRQAGFEVGKGEVDAVRSARDPAITWKQLSRECSQHVEDVEQAAEAVRAVGRATLNW